jgi:hypothetical protein
MIVPPCFDSAGVLATEFQDRAAICTAERVAGVVATYHATKHAKKRGEGAAAAKKSAPGGCSGRKKRKAPHPNAVEAAAARFTPNKRARLDKEREERAAEVLQNTQALTKLLANVKRRWEKLNDTCNSTFALKDAFAGLGSDANYVFARLTRLQNDANKGACSGGSEVQKALSTIADAIHEMKKAAAGRWPRTEWAKAFITGVPQVTLVPWFLVHANRKCGQQLSCRRVCPTL